MINNSIKYQGTVLTNNTNNHQQLQNKNKNKNKSKNEKRKIKIKVRDDTLCECGSNKKYKQCCKNKPSFDTYKKFAMIEHLFDNLLLERMSDEEIIDMHNNYELLPLNTYITIIDIKITTVCDKIFFLIYCLMDNETNNDMLHQYKIDETQNDKLKTIIDFICITARHNKQKKIFPFKIFSDHDYLWLDNFKNHIGMVDEK